MGKGCRGFRVWKRLYFLGNTAAGTVARECRNPAPRAGHVPVQSALDAATALRAAQQTIDGNWVGELQGRYHSRIGIHPPYGLPRPRSWTPAFSRTTQYVTRPQLPQGRLNKLSGRAGRGHGSVKKAYFALKLEGHPAAVPTCQGPRVIRDSAERPGCETAFTTFYLALLGQFP